MTLATALVILKDTLQGDINYKDKPLYKELFKVCDDAMRKQVPKKPKNIGSLGGEGIYFYGKCPSCNDGVNYEMNCCSYCGQRLDWSETK